MPLVDYFHGDGRVAHDYIDFPRNVSADHDDPAGYLATEPVRAAVNVALNLGLPLLVTGEPGTGKSVLGKAIARELKYQLIEFVAKSTTTATDLLYRFDAVRQFRDAQIEALNRELTPAHRVAPTGKHPVQNLAPYIRFEALGRAIALTYAADHPLLKTVWDEEANSIPGKEPAERRSRSVVLIDEVDKAPRDVPNDLLVEIDRGTFRIAETGIQLSVQNDLYPIVILTSNSEKSLPDAFLRRCVFHHIEFPKPLELTRIIASRLPELVTPDAGAPSSNPQLVNVRHLTPLASEGMAFLTWLRPGEEGRYDPLRKPPSIAEFLAWLRLLLRSGFSPSTPLVEALGNPAFKRQVEMSLGVLLKDRLDLARVVSGDLALDQWRKTLP